MDLLFYGQTDRGCKRQLNEDYYKISDKINLVVVCDGMGGHDSGDVASQLVAETMVDIFSRLTEKYMRNFTRFISLNSDIPLIAQRLYICTQLANARLLQYAKENSTKKGMGTTLLAVYFFRGNAIILHVGDSRCYRIRNSQIETLTKDHSYAQTLLEEGEISKEEFENFNQKNVITRAIGMGSDVKIDISVLPVEDGDLFLLCTDGLWDKVSEDIILNRINQMEDKLQDTIQQLIQDAIQAGGDDNITGVFAKNVKTGLYYENLPKKQYTLAISSSDEVKEYQTLVKKLFKGKKRTVWPFIILLGILNGFIIVYFTLFQNKQPVEIMETTLPEKEKKIQQRVYFAPSNVPEWNSAQVFVDGVACETLGELGNGWFFDVGKHLYELRIDTHVVMKGEFECVVDPTGQRNLIEVDLKKE